jgi:gamma-glutamylcyclotransferase (GGCT)/AIG2-like uncharacterized protein YtfP
MIKINEANHLYVAYGANTNLDSMRVRCPGSVALGKAYILDHELVFHNFADVRYKMDSHCEAVLWSVTDEDLVGLDRFEGYPFHYTRNKVAVKFRGNVLMPWCYFMNDQGYNRPSDHYIDMIKEGYVNFGLDVSQIEKGLRKCYKVAEA